MRDHHSTTCPTERLRRESITNVYEAPTVDLKKQSGSLNFFLRVRRKAPPTHARVIAMPRQGRHGAASVLSRHGATFDARSQTRTYPATERYGGTAHRLWLALRVSTKMLQRLLGNIWRDTYQVYFVLF